MTSALDNVGAHLLGRNVSAPDPRNWQLGTFLDGGGTATPLDAALDALLAGYAGKATKAWARLVTQALDAMAPTPPVPPTPPAPPAPTPSGAVEWLDTEPVLDQGQTPHCIGDGGAQWGNTPPVDDRYTQADADVLYYACKTRDGEPGQENGSSVHTLAKELAARGRIGGYAWAANVDQVAQWVLGHGPVIFGTDWYDSMFTPDANGLIVPTGQLRGGHCYVVVGYDPATQLFKILNSWSASWGINGRAYLHYSSVRSLLATQGEALAAVELAAA